MGERELPHAPATLRNREPILKVLQNVLPPKGLLLEIASGTGEHAAFIAPRLGTTLEWQPSEVRSEMLADIDGHTSRSACAQIRPSILLDVCESEWPIAGADAVFCANMIHIAPWAAAKGLFEGASRILDAGMPLVLYGPYKRQAAHTAPSNAAFDAGLRAQNPLWGVRCLDTEVAPLADRVGFALEELIAMPANNFTVVFRRRS